MSSYAEMVQRRSQANALLFELWTLGLDVRAEWCADGTEGRRVVVDGLRSLNPDHADRLVQLVRDNEAGLVEILLSEREPDPATTHLEGSGV